MITCKWNLEANQAKILMETIKRMEVLLKKAEICIISTTIARKATAEVIAQVSNGNYATATVELFKD